MLGGKITALRVNREGAESGFDPLVKLLGGKNQ